MRLNKALPALIVLAVLAVLGAVFPLFHIRSLDAVREGQGNAQFNAADFAANYWTGTLLPAAGQAVSATTVLDKIAADPKFVRDQLGHTMGVGNSYYLFLRGDGRVVSADESSIGLSLKADSDEIQIVIELGFVFGNAVRDATGLIQASSYPNSQEFNDIAASLNSIVETQVLPHVQRIAKVGSRIHFVGCVDLGDEDTDLIPLRLVPVEVKEMKP